MAADVTGDFPLWALLPKKESGVAAFLSKYPEYDGRGVTIAIFDTGIDPGAPGMQKTSHGLPKVIDMIDASGAGDVDTSTIVEAENGEITGLTGRKLKVPSSWQNPSGQYHIGLKSAYELYPKKLRERIQREYKEKVWNPEHNICKAQAFGKLQDFNSKFPNASQLTPEQKLEKEDLEATVEVLKTLDKVTDAGPIFDCIVFNDGSKWRACLDTSEKGDLESCQLLGVYRETLQYGTISKEDMMNYGINIFEEGNMLQIVGMSADHGTHVASISAAYFPDEPEKNGIAPGAQLISICIGDNRIGSMETGTSITRAVIKAIESKCDIVNMSYGEQSHWSNGRILDTIRDMVDRHGIIMCCSGGNEGPALSTVGMPPSMSHSSVIGVGAYVTPDMMVAEYSMREKMPGMGYTWTARGPTPASALGISVCAPGGAITSVPQWTLQGKQLMNGTSMSSPYVAGSVAILLSGLKQRNLGYSPYSIQRSLEITALKVPTWEAFSMGHGLIQVEKAFDWLLENVVSAEGDVRFSIMCGEEKKQGIVLREPHTLNKPSIVTVKVEPTFLNSANVDNARKLAFSMNCNIACDVSWIQVPAHLSLMHSCRPFTVRLDPSGLPAGSHFTFIKAYEAGKVDKGPVFQVPVTIIKPQRVVTQCTEKEDYAVESLLLKPGVCHRHFLHIPAGSTWAVLRIQSCDPEQNSVLTVHAVHLLPHQSCKSSQYHKTINLDSLAETKCAFPVRENRTLEICLTKWWANIGDVSVNFYVYFHGLKPSQEKITMQPASGVLRLDVTTGTRSEEMMPNVILKYHDMVLRPTESKVQPLSSRDVIPVGRQVYEIVLTYAFNVSKASEVFPTCPMLSDYLYESPFESQIWMLFDANKRLLCTGDAFPSKYGYNVKVEKGDFTIKLQVRHEERPLLEKLSDLPFTVSLRLPSCLTLDVYSNFSHSLTNGKKYSSGTVKPSTVSPIYIAPLLTEKIPKGCSAGHYLQGTITFTKDELGKKANAYTFYYLIPELPKKTSSKNAEKAKTPEEELTEAMRECKISWLAKLQGAAQEELYKELTAKYPNHPPVLQAWLQVLDDSKERQNKLPEIVKTATELLALLDRTDILAQLGAKNGKKDPAASKSLEKQKNMVIDVLMRLGSAKASLYLNESDSVTSTQEEKVTLAEIDDLHVQLMKFADPTDTKISSFVEKHSATHKHWGRALQMLFKQQEEKSTLETDKKLIEIFQKLGWKHCVEFYERTQCIRFPPNYPLI